MESISNGVLIDPSLLLAKNSVSNTFKLVEKFSTPDTGFNFFYPKSLQRLIQREGLSSESSSIKFFLPNAHPSDLRQLSTAMKEYSVIISSFEIASEIREKYGRIYDSMHEVLGEELHFGKEPFDEDIVNILFEEWVFLNEYSWVVSRIKKPFNRFVTAGSICLQFGCRATELLTRKTLRKKDDDMITNVDRLRAFGKWIAVGGPSVIGMFANPIVSAASPAIAGFFLLFDPKGLNPLIQYI